MSCCLAKYSFDEDVSQAAGNSGGDRGVQTNIFPVFQTRDRPEHFGPQTLKLAFDVRAERGLGGQHARKKCTVVACHTDLAQLTPVGTIILNLIVPLVVHIVGSTRRPSPPPGSLFGFGLPGPSPTQVHPGHEGRGLLGHLVNISLAERCRATGRRLLVL